VAAGASRLARGAANDTEVRVDRTQTERWAPPAAAIPR